MARFRITLALLPLVFFACVAPLWLASIASAETIALVGGTLVNPDETLEGSVIVIEGSRIRNVGKDLSVVPAQARRIDLSNKWVIPGLIDSHVHLERSGGLYSEPSTFDLRASKPYATEYRENLINLEDTLLNYLRSGVTTIADLGSHFEFRRELLARIRVLKRRPRVLTSGPMIVFGSPSAAVGPDAFILPIDSQSEARAAVVRLRSSGSDIIKINLARPPESPEESIKIVRLIRAVVSESTTPLLPVIAHANTAHAAKLAIEGGVRVLAHGITDQRMDPTLFDLIKNKNVFYIATLSPPDGYCQVFYKKVPRSSYELRFSNPQVLSTLFDYGTVVLERANRLAGSVSRTDLANLSVMHREKVSLVAGTDSGLLGTLHGPSLFREFALLQYQRICSKNDQSPAMVQSALSSRDILRSATINAAAALGLESEVGSIEVGKIADIVILDEDPLLDISNTQKIHAVVKDGIYYTAVDLNPNRPKDLIQTNINAFNAKNPEVFAETFHPDATIIDGHSGNVLLDGRQQIHSRFKVLFSFDIFHDQHIEVLNRQQIGGFFVETQKRRGRRDSILNLNESVEAKYEIQDDLIYSITYTNK